MATNDALTAQAAGSLYIEMCSKIAHTMPSMAGNNASSFLHDLKRKLLNEHRK